MSIRKDLVIKISNGVASLDMPLQIYEKDHGIELRFKLMDYKYKYDKDPDNILNSNEEDILEAYTTIVNPSGYELAQINGEVLDDTVKFMIEDSYTDELEEIGIYQLQIHVKCEHSEFSIPPIQFEVLGRLKGEKVVTDGDDEVDDSVIIDGSTKFIDDETGKLIIQWQKGDSISSVRLNAMVEVINNAVDEEAQRQLNEEQRQANEVARENRLQAALNSADAEVKAGLDKIDAGLNVAEQRIQSCEDAVDNKLANVDSQVDNKLDEYDTRFNALTASQQQDAEVIDARDGEVSLKARLDRDVRTPLQVYEDVEDSYISCDSTTGYAQNVEILGNTIQDAENLADIRSVGDKIEGQEVYKIDVVSCGKNLFDGSVYKKSGFYTTDGSWYSSPIMDTYRFRVNQNTTYIKSGAWNGVIAFFDKDMNFISGTNEIKPITPNNCYYMTCSVNVDEDLTGVQLEEGTVATPYEPYQEDKLTILSPVQLEKVGNVRDRIICKDDVWGVEKNIETIKISEWNDIAKGNSSSDSFATYHIRNIKGLVTGSLTDIISTKLPVSTSQGNERIYKLSNANEVICQINSNIDTIDKFKEYMKDDLFKYIINSTFIPLPHDQQIKIRTFAGKTNIHFECEIEPTIKASVQKSLGATVNSHSEQIDNLSKELDRVKKLEESVTSTVVTESDFTTVNDTSNGYFEDVKLEGKTLVNLMYEGTHMVANGETHYVSASVATMDDFASKLKTSTRYTIIMYNAPENVHSVYFGGSVSSLKVEPNIFILNTPEDKIVSAYFHFYTNNGEIPSDVLSGIKVVILEGDHTQNPPSYFEGLMSVGEDVDDVSVVSVNENLFDINSDVRYKAKVYEKNKCILSYEEHTTKMEVVSDKLLVNFAQWRGLYFGVWLKPNTSYEISFDKSGDTYSNLIDGRNTKIVTTNSEGKAYWQFEPNSIGYMILSNIMVKETSVVTNNHIPHQTDKKRLLYYNTETQTWEKPILREWDSIEKHSDGKYYYHKRSGEVVLNGSESWVGNYTFANAGRWSYALSNVKEGSLLICDRFINKSNDSTGEESIFTKSSNLLLTLNNDKGSIETWIQANPTTVVYQLAQEEVYECTTIDLITYENETNFIVNTGVIAPLSTLKVMCNINNVVRELQQKVSNLENYIQHVMIDALNNALNE